MADPSPSLPGEPGVPARRVSAPGYFLVIEGPDGSGKSTQARKLASALHARGIRSCYTSQPTDGAVGKEIRCLLSRKGKDVASWQHLALLFAADRVGHLKSYILPMLADGFVVVCDRYDLSSLIYQSIGGDPDQVQWVRALNRYALRPDLTIVLETSPDKLIVRGAHRPEQHDEFDDARYAALLSYTYQRAGSILPKDNTVFVPGDPGEDEVGWGVLTTAIGRLQLAGFTVTL